MSGEQDYFQRKQDERVRKAVEAEKANPQFPVMPDPRYRLVPGALKDDWREAGLPKTAQCGHNREPIEW